MGPIVQMSTFTFQTEAQADLCCFYTASLIQQRYGLM
jgi:hypothetical protein